MTGWREIPMPAGVTQLLRTEGGLPVPHVAAWSSEVVDRVDRDEHLAAAGVTWPAVFCSGAAGEGRAVLGEMEPSRQRRAALALRCQVCDAELGDRHRPNPPWRTPLWLADLRIHGGDALGTVGHDIGGQTIVIGRRRCPLIFEPWTCESCLAYALQVCPGLIKRQAAAPPRRRPPLRLLRVRRAHPVAVRGRVTGDGPVAGQVGVTYVKLAVSDFDIVLPHTFLAEHRQEAA